VIDIKFLEFQVGFFKIVWTMVSSQRKCLYNQSFSKTHG
jgi:hypothetical protein